MCSSDLRFPIVSTLVSINFLFLMGFSMMHGTFILFTSMAPADGGLGWSELDNGWIFAFIGLLASSQGVRVEERTFSRLELRRADEAFLTNAVAGVLPLTSLDRRAIGTGGVGYVTARLSAAYRAAIAEDMSARA